MKNDENFPKTLPSMKNTFLEKEQIFFVLLI